MRQSLLVVAVVLLAARIASAGATMKVPSTTDTTKGPGTTLTVPVSVSGAGNVNAFQVVLQYNPAVLTYAGFTVSSWFTSGTPSLVMTTVIGPAPFYDVTSSSYVGKAVNIEGMRMDGTGVSVSSTSSQILITISFNVTAWGSSFLNLVTDTTTTSGCALINTSFASLSLALTGGNFTNVTPIHDLAVTAVWPTPASVVEGGVATLNVTVSNVGNQDETFSIQISTGSTTITTLTLLSLTAGSTATFTYAWTTTGITPGTYPLTGYVPPVSGETAIANNTLTGSALTVTPPVIHDLAVTAVTATSTSFTLGGSTTINYTVKNLGTVSEVFTADITAGGATIGSLPSTTIAAGATYSGSLTWTPAATGTYAISVYVPPVTGETVTANNTMAGPTISVSAPLVYDVAITALTATPTGVIIGAPVALSITFSNVGSGAFALPAWSVSLGGTVIVSDPGGASLAPGATLTVTPSWTSAGSAGAFVLTALVGAVPGETNLTNNSITGPSITLTAPIHDGATTAMTAGPTSAPTGTLISLTATIANEGNVSDSMSVAFTANGVTVATKTITLGAGASGGVSASWDTTGWVASTYAMAATVTVPGDVNPANNTMAGPTVALTGPVSADLANLTGKSAWPEKHHYSISSDTDGKFTMFAKVINLGTSPVFVKVQFKMYDATGTLVGTYVSGAVELLAAGTTGIVAYDLSSTALTVDSSYTVVAQAQFIGESVATTGTWSSGTNIKQFGFTVVP